MKAISLWQPWATLIAVGVKRLETRSWDSRYQGELAIHAAKRWTADEQDLIQESPFREALQGHRMPRGAIVAVVRLTGCLRTTDCQPSYPECAFGNYAAGRFAWVLEHVRTIEPVPCRGRQSLWEVPEDVEARIRSQLERGADGGVRRRERVA